jgi:C-terminal peptidase prc
VSSRQTTNVRVAIVLSVFLVGFCPWQNAWPQPPRSPAATTEVHVYGNEQAIVDAITKKSHAAENRTYPNELDHVLSVLLSRAFPTPKAEDLARHTIDAICKEAESFGHAKVPDSQRQAWVMSAARTGSFQTILDDIETAGHVKRGQLVNSGLVAMLRATDCGYAGVLSRAETDRIMNMFEARSTPSKERGSLGVDVSQWPTIKVVPHTPAAKVGLRDGDVVLRVNSRAVGKTEPPADALKILHGAPDTTISLTVRRGDKTLSFEVCRALAAERIDAQVIEPGVIHIRIPQFEGSGIARRVKELVDKHVTGATSCVILDLRDNPGGRAEEANGVADIFLDNKTLQIYQFADGRRMVFRSKLGALDVPVIVLTNHNTGCSAETLAIALHDNHRAMVIGQRTAGVLSGHDFEKLKDGRMIVFRSEPTVLSPTGKDYSETGLPPDIVVNDSNGPGGDKILERAIQLARSLSRGKATSAAGSQ